MSNTPLLMLEIRLLSGALVRTHSDLSPTGRRDSQFTLNGVGVIPTSEVAQVIQASLVYEAEAMRPSQSGATYVDFLDLDGVTPERMRASYSPEGWERLVEIRDRYDPENLFSFNRNIPPSSEEE